MSSVSSQNSAYSNYSQLNGAVAFKGKPVQGFWLGLPTALKNKILQGGPTEFTKRTVSHQQALSNLIDLPTVIKNFFKKLF